MIPGLLGCTAIDITRPDVIAGPIDRARSPENVSAENSLFRVVSTCAAGARERCCCAPPLGASARTATIDKTMAGRGDRSER